MTTKEEMDALISRISAQADADSTAPLTSEESEDKTRRVFMWDALARVLGFNELAREAVTMGEKVYFRMARGFAEEQYALLGGELNKTEESEVVLTISRDGATVVFREFDIELMRAAVADYDRKKSNV
jgi:hypothetical protein